MEPQASKTGLNILIVISIILISASLVLTYTKKPAPVIPPVVKPAEQSKPAEQIPEVSTTTVATSTPSVSTSTTATTTSATTSTTIAFSTDFADKKWTWSSKTIKDTKNATAFSITLHKDNKVSGTTDCNTFSGTYKVENGKISFGPFASTKMFCKDSQENEFLSLLAKATTLSVTMEKGLLLTSGTTTMTFK